MQTQQPSSQFLQRQKEHEALLHPFATDNAPHAWGGLVNAGQFYELGFGHDLPLTLPDASQHGLVYNKPVHEGNFRSVVLRNPHLEHAGHRDTKGDLAPGARRTERVHELARARSGRQTPLERWESFVPDIHRGYVDPDAQAAKLVALSSEYQGLQSWYGLSPIN